MARAHTSYASALSLRAAHYGVATPCVEAVRRWVPRLGLYLVRRLPQRRAAWAWIIDPTSPWGTARCLVILGVSQAHLSAHGFRLGPAAVCGLALAVVGHPTGEVVQRRLTALAERVGVPRQIVSAHGADLAKGIRLFQQARPAVIATYDVTHRLACLREGLSGHDGRWQALVRRCGATGTRLRQPAGSLLLPPPLRTEARSMNLEALPHWAERMPGFAMPAGATRLATALELPVPAACACWQETFAWLEGFRTDLETGGPYRESGWRAEAQARATGLCAGAGQQ